jgi:hypothetical protein
VQFAWESILFCCILQLSTVAAGLVRSSAVRNSALRWRICGGLANRNAIPTEKISAFYAWKDYCICYSIEGKLRYEALKQWPGERCRVGEIVATRRRGLASLFSRQHAVQEGLGGFFCRPPQKCPTLSFRCAATVDPPLPDPHYSILKTGNMRASITDQRLQCVLVPTVNAEIAVLLQFLRPRWIG